MHKIETEREIERKMASRKKAYTTFNTNNDNEKCSNTNCKLKIKFN